MIDPLADGLEEAAAQLVAAGLRDQRSLMAGLRAAGHRRKAIVLQLVCRTALKNSGLYRTPRPLPRTLALRLLAAAAGSFGPDERQALDHLLASTQAAPAANPPGVYHDPNRS